MLRTTARHVTTTGSRRLRRRTIGARKSLAVRLPGPRFEMWLSA